MIPDSVKTAPETECLLRFFKEKSAGRILVLNCSDPAFSSVVSTLPGSNVLLHTYDYACRRLLPPPEEGGTEAYFGAWVGKEKGFFDAALVYSPRSRARMEMMLDNACEVVRAGGILVAAGKVREGIRGMRRIMEGRGLKILRSDSARHCVVFTATIPDGVAPARGLRGWMGGFDAPFMGRNFRCVSYPGVFSAGELDEGTRMLLGTFDGKAFADVLDMGSGTGVLGAALRLSGAAARLDMVDNDALAVESSRETLAANGIPADGVWPSDAFSDVARSYDLILSNPPFHKGAEATLETAAAFLKGCRLHLKQGGRIRIVANRFLDYPPIIERELGGMKVLAGDRRYRVYEAFRVG